MQIYSSEIVRIGEQAKLFLDEGIIKYDGKPSEMKNCKDKTVLQFLEVSGRL